MNMIQTIPLENLAFTFMPVFAVIVILLKWKLNAGNTCYAITRMLLQLLLIGYFLNYIFASNSAWITLLILVIMIIFSSWIALGSVKEKRNQLIIKTIIAVSFGGGITFWIIVNPVLELQPWYQARYAIPLGGMIFANVMNSISLAAERFQSEINNNVNYHTARNTAFNAAMIPTINALFAVGLVSLPGMMTGQILSGVSPFIAARYQIMVMTMIFASSGLSSACFLYLLKNKHS